MWPPGSRHARTSLRGPGACGLPPLACPPFCPSEWIGLQSTRKVRCHHSRVIHNFWVYVGTMANKKRKRKKTTSAPESSGALRARTVQVVRGGAAPQPLAPSRSGRRSSPRAAPITIRHPDGREQVVSPTEFKKNHPAAGSASSEKGGSPELRKELRSVLARFRAQGLTTKEAGRLAARARQLGGLLGMDAERIDDLLRRAASSIPLDRAGPISLGKPKRTSKSAKRKAARYER
jgi:hypothetical protein